MIAETNSNIYRDALLEARDYSTDFLLERADALAFDAADPDPDFPGEVGRHLASERLRAFRDELARRECLARATTGLPGPARPIGNTRSGANWPGLFGSG